MLEFGELLLHLEPALNANVKILIEIIKSIYSISSGGITMKNISRWTGKGASYRSIQRFFSSPIDWLRLNLLLFRNLYIQEFDGDRYIVSLDEVVEDKAGKQTHGINWFYSSISGKVIRSISCHVISIIDTVREQSFVLAHKQTVKEEPLKKEKSRASWNRRKEKKEKKEKKSRGKAGRPKGSKNRQNVKKTGLLYESFAWLLKKVTDELGLVGMGVRYVVGDGAYGNKTCCLIAKEFGLELISKLNRNTGLYLPYRGTYGGRGRPKKYGKKIDYKKLPKKYLVDTELTDGFLTKIYQIKGAWTKQMPCLINVVILVKTNLKTKKTGRVILFTTDLNMVARKIRKFYSLRFQIEFNFRDAKQYFGLSDFKNIKERQINNAVGLSLFMDNVSLILIGQAKEKWAEDKVSIQDLKAYFRAQKYLEKILNTLNIDPEPILIQTQFADVFKVGAINRKQQLESVS